MTQQSIDLWPVAHFYDSYIATTRIGYHNYCLLVSGICKRIHRRQEGLPRYGTAMKQSEQLNWWLNKIYWIINIVVTVILGIFTKLSRHLGVSATDVVESIPAVVRQGWRTHQAQAARTCALQVQYKISISCVQNCKTCSVSGPHKCHTSEIGYNCCK